MSNIVKLDRISAGLKSLGLRRLIALGFTGLTVFALISFGGYFLSRPATEVLYSGLEPQDVTRVGAALQEAGITFDVNTKGDTVSVAPGQTAAARMLLAEKGLPQSDRAGYELFDNLGSLGLTSFMQQVTQVRALEGELARTIQLMRGVRAARVHIVIPKDGSFRSVKEQATASVLIRADEGAGRVSAQAIRHLVAAAIPGLSAGQVSVLNTDGELLAGNDDGESAAPERIVGLERSFGQDIQERISRTISPYLGIDNFRVSVAAKLNTDRRKVDETIFDPESKVERSVRTIKETGKSENSDSQSPVGVQQNIPQEASASAGQGEQSSESKERKEELTNFEISSKAVSTVSDGYQVERLSIAILVNRGRVMSALGENATPEGLDAQLKELEALAGSAAGINVERGDVIKIKAVDFLDTASALEPIPPEGVFAQIVRHLGSMINAVAMIAAALIVLLVGLRPTIRTILEFQAQSPAPARIAGGGTPAASDDPVALASGDAQSMIADLSGQIRDMSQKRLAQIVELDSDRAARIMKQWLNQPEGRAT